MNTPETHTFAAETAKVLQLMIHSLYTNRDIFLRELISNASDACDKLRFEALTRPELSDEAALAITLKVDKDARTLTLTDNGIGMSREELIANLGTIAKSGTQEFLAQAKDASLIGQFGVGFYSAFMVADKVEVISTRAGSSETHLWRSDGLGEFTITEAPTHPRGTSIKLYLKKEAEEYLDSFRLKHIVTTYSDHIPFPILLDGETLNRASALWTRPKSEITPEQYKEFYHHTAHLPDDPWLTLHHKAEGKLEYASLLFIPSIKPFDLFHPERKTRVKLYVKRVFIAEDGLSLIPHWLRFLRGVVDSQDLPLNISRETLQANPTLEKVSESLVKRVLSELKKEAQNDAGAYAKFWANFGAVLKEGLCEATTPREQILEICRFATTHESATTGLDDYISRMHSDQDTIYFLTGDSLEVLRKSPQLEGFAAHGIEVLLMCDHVDDFWVTVNQSYKGKKLQSVTRADITAEKKEESAQSGLSPLLQRAKEVLGEHVQDVRLTSKLKESPACLAVPDGAMDIRLERFLIEQKQLPRASAKILELNPQHAIVQSLAAQPNSAESEDTIWLLFDQARLLEGEAIDDPAAFSRRLNNFVQKGLAA